MGIFMGRERREDSRTEKQEHGRNTDNLARGREEKPEKKHENIVGRVTDFQHRGACTPSFPSEAKDERTQKRAVNIVSEPER